MIKDIFTEYTKDQNKTCGRKGYFNYDTQKITDIPPNQYGMFLNKRKGRKR